MCGYSQVTIIVSDISKNLDDVIIKQFYMIYLKNINIFLIQMKYILIFIIKQKNKNDLDGFLVSF